MIQTEKSGKKKQSENEGEISEKGRERELYLKISPPPTRLALDASSPLHDVRVPKDRGVVQYLFLLHALEHRHERAVPPEDDALPEEADRHEHNLFIFSQ